MVLALALALDPCLAFGPTFPGRDEHVWRAGLCRDGRAVEYLHKYADFGLEFRS